jgi:hypothetical protein
VESAGVLRTLLSLLQHIQATPWYPPQSDYWKTLQGPFTRAYGTRDAHTDLAVWGPVGAHRTFLECSSLALAIRDDGSSANRIRGLAARQIRFEI